MRLFIIVAARYDRFGTFASVATDGLTEEAIFEELVAPRCQVVVDDKAAMAAEVAAAAEQRRKVAAHEQLLRDFAHIHGVFEAEREAEKTPEELAEIATLEAAAKGKKKPAKLPPPRMERLKLAITPEGMMILPTVVVAPDGDGDVGGGGDAAEAKDGDDATAAAAASPRSVKLARFGRDVLVLPDKTRCTLGFTQPGSEDEVADAAVADATAAAAAGEASDDAPQRVVTVTTDEDGLVFTRVEEEPVEVEEPPPEDPNAVESVAASLKSLPVGHASLLVAEFGGVEEQFEAALRRSFEAMSAVHVETTTRLQVVRQAFVSFLQRQDSKQEIIDATLRDINAMPNDMRFDADAKAELHQRISDAVKALTSVVEARRTENDADLAATKANGFLANRLQVLQAHLCVLVQAEVNRSFGTRQLLADLYALRAFKVLGAGAEDGVDAVNVLPALGDEADAGGKTASKKKKGKKTAETDEDSPSAQLEACTAAAGAALEELGAEHVWPKVSELAQAQAKAGRVVAMGAEDVAASVEARVLLKELHESRRRVRRIRRVGVVLCTELTAHAEAVYAALAQYNDERIAHEFAVVQTFADHLRGLVEAEQQVEFALRVEHVRPPEPALLRAAQNGLPRLIEDRQVRLIPESPPPVVRDVQSLNSRVCSRHQLVGLARAFRAAAVAAYPSSLDQGVSPLLPLPIASQVVQRQIASGALPSAWAVDDAALPQSAWADALWPFVVLPFEASTSRGHGSSSSNNTNNDSRVGAVVDWRTVLVALWEASLEAEGHGGALGPCNGAGDLLARVERLRAAHQALQACSDGNDVVDVDSLTTVPRSRLWFAAGEPELTTSAGGDGDGDGGDGTEEGEAVLLPEPTAQELAADAEVAARHATTLEFLLAGWGTGSNGDAGLDYVSLLGYAVGVGAPTRATAVTAAVATLGGAKAVPTHRQHGAEHIDAKALHLGSNGVRLVFPSSRGLGPEATALNQAMRAASATKLSVKEILDATATSHSHVVPVLQPHVVVGESSSDSSSVGSADGIEAKAAPLEAE